MKDFYPPIVTFQSLQEIQAHFCALNKFINSPKEIFSFLKGEIRECAEAIENNDIQEIKSELADILIFAATAANSMGFELQDAIIGNMFEQNSRAKNSGKISDLQAFRKTKMTHEIQPEGIIFHLLQQIETVENNESENNQRAILNIVGNFSLGVIDVANKYKINLEQALSQKLTRNYKKYNPYKRMELIESGLQPDEAYIIQKKQWNRKHDKRFIF